MREPDDTFDQLPLPKDPSGTFSGPRPPVSSEDATVGEDTNALPGMPGATALSIVTMAGGGSDTEASAELGPAGPALFELRRVIGRGGFGEVWEAEQVSLRRLVAVKRLRDDVLQRSHQKSSGGRRIHEEFRQEALIAARLEHPNIVPVHDLGRDEQGGPLLAMKLVRGKPWNRVLEEDFPVLDPAMFLGKHLPVLVDVAQAVAFAHANGIVHRDIKPSQVMTGEFGETLLMDWGLALIFDEAHIANDNTGALGELNFPSTDSASSPAGTPVLMAPEQTQRTAAGIGPWTDVYLLGGTLYFLLTGTFPHEAATSVEAMRRAAIGEIDPPSRRASGRWIPQELVTLCLSSLKANPAERLATAQDFVSGLQEWLTGATRRRESEALTREAETLLEKVERSRASSTSDELYEQCDQVNDRVQRSLRAWAENPTAGPLLARMLVLRIEREIAEGDLFLARQHLRMLEADPGKETASHPRELRRLLQDAEQQRVRVRRQRVVFAVAASLLFVAALVFAGIAESRRRQTETARKQAEAARELAEASHKAADEARVVAEEERKRAELALTIASDQADSAFNLVTYVLTGMRDQMKEHLQGGKDILADEVIEARHNIAGGVAGTVLDYLGQLDPKSWPTDFQILHTRRLYEVAREFGSLGRYEEALKLLDVAEELARGFDGDDALPLVDLLFLRGSSLNHLGRAKEAEDVLMQSLGLTEMYPSRNLRMIRSSALNALGGSREGMGKYGEALEAYEAAMAELKDSDIEVEPMQLASIANNLASLLSVVGRYDEAFAYAQEAEAQFYRVGELDSLGIAVAWQTMAMIEAERGNLPRMVELMEQVLEGRLRELGSRHPFTLSAYHNLGAGYYRLGRMEEGERHLLRAMEGNEVLYGPDHHDVAAAKNILGMMYLEQRRDDEALVFLKDSVRVAELTWGRQSPNTGAAYRNLGRAYANLRDFTAAIENLEIAQEILERVLGPRHVGVAAVQSSIATCHFERGDFEEAIALSEAAKSIALEAGPAGINMAFAADGVIAQAQRELGTRGLAPRLRELLSRESIVDIGLRPLVRKLRMILLVELYRDAMDLQAQDDYSGAMVLWEELIEQARRGKGEHWPIEAIVSITAAKYFLGDAESAREFIASGWEIRDTLKDDQMRVHFEQMATDLGWTPPEPEDSPEESNPEADDP